MTTLTYEVELKLHEGQRRIMESAKPIVAAICGSQGGKTVMGPPWMLREIQMRGEGDYLIGSSTYPLLNLKVLPECVSLWDKQLHLGKLRDDHGLLTVEMPRLGARVIFFSAKNPDSIESATAKAAWLDEAGQYQFHHETWDAVQRRLRIKEGRVLITTTPYCWSWLKTEIYDAWKAGSPDIDVITWESIVNPAFPRAEWDRAERTLPRWKFDMFYRGIFTRPAGIIYDCFDADNDVVEPFEIPAHWPRYTGHDFGGTNTAALWIAQNPVADMLYVYREYLEGGLTAAGHAGKFRELSKGERIVKSVGGAPSEDQWRDEFGAAGWPISEPPFKNVEVGIQRVYGWHRSRKFKVFNTCRHYVAEKTSYSRKLGDDYKPHPTDIEDKESFHLMDAERYIVSDFAEPVVAATNAEFSRTVHTPYREWDVG